MIIVQKRQNFDKNLTIYLVVIFCPDLLISIKSDDIGWPLLKHQHTS